MNRNWLLTHPKPEDVQFVTCPACGAAKMTAKAGSFNKDEGHAAFACVCGECETEVDLRFGHHDGRLFVYWDRECDEADPADDDNYRDVWVELTDRERK